MPPPYTAVVTGGSAGIGAAICLSFLEAGYEVVSLARRPPETTHPKWHHYGVDLLDPKATVAVAAQVAKDHQVSHFVHNAGVIWPNKLEDVRLEELQGLSQLHLGAALCLVQAFVPAMRQQGFGRIVLLSSRGALGLPTRTAYAATKSGMLGMARTWALELASDGITVNVVSPGPIQTDMFYEVIEAGSAREAALAKSLPVQRLGRCDDVSRAVMFFAHPDNSFVTGQNLFVCGGGSISSLTI